LGYANHVGHNPTLGSVCPVWEITIMSDIAERYLHTRIARSVEAIRRSFVDNLFYITVRTFDNATPLDHYTALAYTIRDRLLARVVATNEHYKRKGVKTVAYMSAEFLLGSHLGNNLLNLGLWDNVRQAMNELGLYLEIILETEEEPGLGNGGLGRRLIS
jgi:starch phosphorylase